METDLNRVAVINFTAIAITVGTIIEHILNDRFKQERFPSSTSTSPTSISSISGWDFFGCEQQINQGEVSFRDRCKPQRRLLRIIFDIHHLWAHLGQERCSIYRFMKNRTMQWGDIKLIVIFSTRQIAASSI